MGGIAGAIFGSGSARKANRAAANAVTDANRQNIAFAQGMYDKNVNMYQPQTQYGDAADRMIAGLLGTGGDAAASDAAFANWKSSTGYETNLKEGLDGVVANNAARGTFQSGATAKALQDRGVQVNNKYLQEFIGNLGGQSAVGSNAKGAIAGAGTNMTNTFTQSNLGAANAQAQKHINNANITNNLLNSINGIVSSSFGGGK